MKKSMKLKNLKAYMILYDFIPLESAGGCWGGDDDGNDGGIHGTICSLNRPPNWACSDWMIVGCEVM